MQSYSFPVLYASEKNGKIRKWGAEISGNTEYATSTITFGQVDGKYQTTVREYTTGKNIGKKNETSPYDQCLLETKRKWIDKKEKENYYSKEEEDKNDKNDKNDTKKYFPMLAHSYDPFKHKKNDIIFPCYVQPKLDGLRCIVYTNDNDIVFQSRTGGYFTTMDHLSVELSQYFSKNQSIILDGELYTTEIPFEELAGLIKKKKISEDDKKRLCNVNYHIYDIIEDGTTYEQRMHTISSIFKNLSNRRHSNLYIVPTYEVSDFSNAKKYFNEFVQEGFEGLMLRNKEGIYRCNYRSNDLQKYKEFFEDEFEITDFKQGDGRDKETVIWICKTKDGKEFSVRPRGSFEMRNEWFLSGLKHIGKPLTVIYQELSENGIPRFPVGKSIRDGF